MKRWHRPLVLLPFLAVLLSACDTFLLSSLSSSSPSSSPSSSTASGSQPSTSQPSPSTIPLTSEEVDNLFDMIEPPVAYITEDYRLPVLENAPNLVTWESPHATIVDGILLYSHPVKDETIALFATLLWDGTTYQRAFPLTIKSQLHAPEVNQKAHLHLDLGDNLDESAIQYETTLPATMALRYNQHGTMIDTAIESPLTIRTRGHSTRFMPKRSYRLRFDTNTSLLGMKSAKNYILLANYIDHSQVRNALVHYMSRWMDTLYPIDYRFVDVSINGVYQGHYLLTERVEFHPNRLDIPFVSNDPSWDAGFLVELDIPGIQVNGEGQLNVDYFLLNNKPYAMKEPNLDSPGYRAEHFQYIKTYIEDVFASLQQRHDVSDRIDLANWIDYFLMQEVTKNVDVGWGSVYMVKAPGEKLKHMPLWDFDISMGLGNYFDSGPTGHWGWADFNKNDVFTLMMQYPSIRQQFKSRLAWFETTVLPEAVAWLNTNATRLDTMLQANFEKWPLNVCEGGFCPMVDALLSVDEYEDHLTFLEDFLTARVAWMKQNIG